MNQVPQFGTKSRLSQENGSNGSHAKRARPALATTPRPTTYSPYVWLDGRLVAWDQANVHVLSHGLQYGTCAFEGIRAYNTKDGRPAIFRLSDHLRRLYQSAAYLRMGVPFSPEELREACHAVVSANDLGDCYLRPIFFYGLGGLGFRLADNPVHVAIGAWPWGAFLGAEGMEKGIRLKTVSWQKTSTNAVPSLAKLSGNYVNSVLAFQEAFTAGYDEALILNERGLVSEGSGENVFAVRGNNLFTPPVADHLLPGITRDTVMQLALQEGLRVRATSLSRPELIATDEVFLTGTAAEVTPVREIDGQPIGNGGRGPWTETLQRVYLQTVRGENRRHLDWLDHVPLQVSASSGGI